MHKENPKPWAVGSEIKQAVHKMKAQTCVMHEASNGREEKKAQPCTAQRLNEGYDSIREIVDLMRKQIKDSVPCDKIIVCCDKIRCTKEKVLSLLSKKY